MIPAWSFVSASAAVLVVALLMYVQWRPPQPELRAWIVVSLMGTLLFCVGDVVSTMATTVGADRFAGNVIYGGLALTASGFWMIALRTAGLQGILSRAAGSRFGWLPPVWLGLLWVAALTDPWHGLFATRVLGARSQYHLLWYMYAVSSYTLVIASLAMLTYAARRAPGPLARVNAFTIGAAAVVIMLGSFVYVSWPTTLPFDPTGAGILVGSGLMLIVLYRLGPFALSPIPVTELLQEDSDGVILVDVHDHVLDWNPAARAWLAADVGFGVDLAGQWQGRFARPERPAVALDARTVEEEVLLSADPSGDSPLYQEVGEDRLVRISARPLSDARGNVVCRVLRLRDESNVHRLSGALVEQGTMLSVVLAATDEGVLVRVGDEIRFVNPQFHDILKTPPELRDSVRTEDVLASWLPLVVDPEAMRENVEWLGREAEAPLRDDVDLVDGRTLERTSLPLIQDGVPIGRVWRLRDVTEQRLNEEIRRSGQKFESLGVMAGGIAHDFNNLLVSVMGNASLAMAELEAGSNALDYLKDIERAAERAGELTRQLLTYAGKGRIDLAPVDLSSVVQDVVELIGVSIPNRITLHCDLPGHLPAVAGEASQLRQIAMNLVLNAADAIEEGEGLISLAVDVETLGQGDEVGLAGSPEFTPGRFVSLRVTDSGVGMEPAVRARIFDPFYTTKFTGRGLGLAATLGIVRGHKGFLRVESEYGAGSTFTLLLPAVADPAGAEAEERATDADAWRSDATVLVVDDEPAVAKVAERMLRSAGMRVVVAHAGTEALDVYQEHDGEIDVVLLDISMPELSGPEILAALRSIDPDVRAVFTSGYPEHSVAAQLSDEPELLFIQKPYRLEELREVIRRAVPERRRASH